MAQSVLSLIVLERESINVSVVGKINHLVTNRDKRMIGKIILNIVFVIALLTIGFFLALAGENQLMGEYDLYQCIYNNADLNDFPESEELIQKIQDECACFRNNNYTDFFNTPC